MEIRSNEQYRQVRNDYLKKRKEILDGLEIEPEDRREALDLMREELAEHLQSIIDFREKSGGNLGVTLYHTSDKNVWDGNLEVGDELTLIPGMKNYWGTGVYFSEKDLFDFYKRRRSTHADDRADKPITFVIDAVNIDGIESFKRYKDKKQGFGRHSSRGLLKLTIDSVEDGDDRILVYAHAIREEISKDDLRALRKRLGIKKISKR